MFFFFKQKTAYEMRISDWSSDVCSSDLLVYLGLRALRAAVKPTAADDTLPTAAAASPLRVYHQAVITNLLNPKVIVFYLALLPQFVSPALGPEIGRAHV